VAGAKKAQTHPDPPDRGADREILRESARTRAALTADSPAVRFAGAPIRDLPGLPRRGRALRGLAASGDPDAAEGDAPGLEEVRRHRSNVLRQLRGSGKPDRPGSPPS